jgi:hypothetical protein
MIPGRKLHRVGQKAADNTAREEGMNTETERKKREKTGGKDIMGKGRK